MRRLRRDAPGRRWWWAAWPAAIFVALFTLTQNRWKIDDVLGVAAARPVRRLGRHRLRHLRPDGLGGLGGGALAQFVGALMGVSWAFAGGPVWAIRAITSLRRPGGNTRAPICPSWRDAGA